MKVKPVDFSYLLVDLVEPVIQVLPRLPSSDTDGQ